MMPTRYSVDISFDKTNINKELLKVTMISSLVSGSSTRARVTSLQGLSAAAAVSMWLVFCRTQSISISSGCCSHPVFHGLSA